MSIKQSVIVIGGGFAGLSAATSLTEKGYHVTVVEGRQVLGGRAFSFKDQKTGDTVDNGQHLLMGCYVETQKFLDRIGTLDRLYFQTTLSVDFLGHNDRSAKLSTWPLPAPLNLLSGLLRLKTLSWRERINLLFMHRAIREAQKDPKSIEHLTVTQWLTRWHQSERAQRYLWDLIAIATLNEDPKIAAAGPFVTVLSRAFFGGIKASQLGYSKVGLSDLYTDSAKSFIQEAGGRVEVKAPVEMILFEKGKVSGVQLRDDRKLRANWVISTVQPHAFLKLLPKEISEQDPTLKNIQKLKYAPIVSITFWFDRAITDSAFTGMLDTQVQWCFSKAKLYGESSKDRHAFALVISGAHAFVGWSEAAIRALALEELRRLFPKARDAAVLRTLVVSEHKATLSPEVGSDEWRPSHQTNYPGLLIAGDWTRTGLPATIESACLSGHTCADLIACSTPPNPL